MSTRSLIARLMADAVVVALVVGAAVVLAVLIAFAFLDPNDVAKVR